MQEGFKFTANNIEYDGDSVNVLSLKQRTIGKIRKIEKIQSIEEKYQMLVGTKCWVGKLVMLRKMKPKRNDYLWKYWWK